MATEKMGNCAAIVEDLNCKDKDVLLCSEVGFMDEEMERRKLDIVQAIFDNDVEKLATLLDSPELYKIIYKGDNLLQLAMFQSHEEVFDYMLSLDDFPLDAVNQALVTAFYESVNAKTHDDTYRWSYAYLVDRYFVLGLIRKGADIHVDCFTDGNSCLHAVLHFLERDIEMARLLVEKGLDVNIKNNRGDTPLHLVCSYEYKYVEEMLMFLDLGADITIRNKTGLSGFDMIIRASPDFNATELETLSYYLFDNHSKYDIDGKALLDAAGTDSPTFFDQLLKNVGEVIVNSDDSRWNPLFLFLIKPKYFQLFIDKFDHVISDLLIQELHCYLFGNTRIPVFAKNVYLLMESRLKLEVIDWLCKVDINVFVVNFIYHEKLESSLTELICFLLSYGMAVSTGALKAIFRRFGHCELFKILLHMDVVGDYGDNMEDIRLRLLCDVTLDVQKVIDNPLVMSEAYLREMLPFCAFPKLKPFSSEDRFMLAADLKEKLRNQPQIPLLVELARNVFRKYFVQKLGITNSRQFYTWLKKLPISNHHRKIITLEVELY